MSLFTERTEANEGLDTEEAARVRLQHSAYRAVRRVTCEFSEGTLVLHGRVATYHYKQLAQVTVAGINGVQRIVNDIQVENDLVGR